MDNRKYTKEQMAGFEAEAAKLTNLVADVYKAMGLEGKLTSGLNESLLRGYGCALRQEYNNPWVGEWEDYLTSWVTVGDVVLSILIFEKLTFKHFYSAIPDADRHWLLGYIFETPYLDYVGLVADANALQLELNERKQLSLL